MNKSFFFFFALATIIFISCSNDDDTTEEQPQEANYFALTVGNSWTYDVYRYNNSTMDFEEQGYRIKGTITKSEIINGETYFKFESELLGEGTCDICLEVIGNKSLRDSLGYLIDSNGTPGFTLETTEPYLVRSESFGDIYGEYDPNIKSVTTPTGNFENLDYNESYAILADGSISEGREKTYYKDSQGLQVRILSFVSSPNPFYLFSLAESTILED